MPAALALLSSALWGTADFLGGVLSRRMPALRVVLLSQAFGLLVMVPIVLAGAGASPGRYLWWGFGAGVVGSLAVTAFYRALALGSMTVVAPLAATGAIVPVVVAAFQDELPGPWQVAGIVLALFGAVLASGPEFQAGAANRRSVLLAGVAAAGFGAVLVLTKHGSATDVVMTLASMRVGAVAVIALVTLMTVRELPRLARSDVPLIAAIGLADLTAIAAYGEATRGKLLAVVAVLASLYPVMTVALARKVYGDTVRRVQAVGIALAMAGVVLLVIP